jgi:AraC-like DNA-binding protein
MDGSGTRLVILQIDPDFPDYRPLEKMLAEHEDPLLGLDYGIFEPLLERFTGLFSGDYDCDRARLLYDDIITTITHVPHREVVLDPRIREVLGRLKTEEPDTVSVPELARGVGLSADRFMHLFKENMGLPVRKYLLWLKLQRAARAMKSGANLTRAAHEAGFSDSAHLSRTFKDMFGLSPSRVLANQRETRVNYCHEEGEGEDAHAPGYPS